MPRYLLHIAVFVLGLAAVCGIAIGYIGSNALAFVVTLAIGACYLAGAAELRRYQHVTDALANAVRQLNVAPKSLTVWLETLHASVRNPVRLRIEGERAALPGPALAPYLVGLLVLLGMLGTLLGMVVTLHGTGAALESATDLSAIRSSLAAPVTGLSFAFGTSIAGVATSAMLGLLSALCRRERLQAVQMLDLKTATTLRIFTDAHRREESFRLMQRQAELMPKLVDRLQAMMGALEQQSIAASEQQFANQEAFHAKTETTYRRLATSVELSLKQSVADSARAASAALQPVMQATMDGIARETASLHGNIEQAVSRQLDGLSNGFEASSAKIAGIWEQSLGKHQESNEALVTQMGASLENFAKTFDERSSTLIAGVSTRMSETADNWNQSLGKHQESNEALVTQMGASLDNFAKTFDERSSTLIAGVSTRMSETADNWNQSLGKHQESNEALVTQMGASLENFAKTFDERSSTLIVGVSTRMSETADNWNQSLGKHQESNEALVTQMGASLDNFAKSFDERSSTLIEGVSTQLESTTTNLADAWRESLAQQARTGEQLAAQHEHALTNATSNFEQHAASLLRSMDQSHVELRTELASNSDARLTAWTDALGALASNLREQWQDTSTFAAERQQQICDTLANTANSTVAEIQRLIDTAAEAPKAAADVIAQMRDKLSESMVRDNAMLEERSRLLATLETLLDAVNHASTEQRTAVDALVATSADLLTRVGTQFTNTVDTETAKLEHVAAQVTTSAIEVASLGDAFGAAVQSFGASNALLVEHLERIESALDKSLARSDEQLAYYVAQAREVIDLSMLSQKQIVEDLQHIAGQRGSAGAKAA